MSCLKNLQFQEPVPVIVFLSLVHHPFDEVPRLAVLLLVSKSEICYGINVRLQLQRQDDDSALESLDIGVILMF